MRRISLAINIVTAIVLAYLLLPTLVIVPISFSGKSFLEFPPKIWSTTWYQQLALDQNYKTAFLNSLRVGIPAAALATVLGTCAALGVVRGSLHGGRLLQSFALAPLMLPQIVYALGAYPVMVHLGLAGTYTAVILGHTALCIPVVFITVSASLRSYRQPLELAAMTLGANHLKTLYYVTLPMIRGGVLAGLMIAFTLSFDELIVAMFLASPTTRTVPIILWEALHYELTPLAAAAATLILVITTFALLVSILVRREESR